MADERTEVLSLDELMDLAAEPSSAPTVEFRRPEPTQPTPPSTQQARQQAPTPMRPPAATRPPTPAPAPLNPVATKPAPPPQPRVAPTPRQSRLQPLADQAREFLVTAQEWLRQGDNGLITATLGIALLLLVVVASL